MPRTPLRAIAPAPARTIAPRLPGWAVPAGAPGVWRSLLTTAGAPAVGDCFSQTSARDVARAATRGVHRRPPEDTTLSIAVLDPTLNSPCGGRYVDLVASIGNTPLVELSR